VEKLSGTPPHGPSGRATPPRAPIRMGLMSNKGLGAAAREDSTSLVSPESAQCSRRLTNA